MATERQLAANRENALKSSGPKTAEGKAVVRLNAIQHGLLARDIFVNTRDGREDPDEYAEFLEALGLDLRPQGRLEMVLVVKIAVAYWRLRRAARAEAGELARELKSIDDGATERREADEKNLRDGLVKLNKRLPTDWGTNYDGGPTESERLQTHREDTARNLRKNPLGVVHFIDSIDAAAQEIETTQRLSDPTVLRLRREFARDGATVTDVAFGPLDAGSSGEEFCGGKTRQLSKDQTVALLSALREERETLTALLEEVKGRRTTWLDSKRAAVSLPSDEAVQRIQRYETTSERQLYQAMNQLERLQRRRFGEPTIPPITVNIEQPA